jgi:hypothetical protein
LKANKMLFEMKHDEFKTTEKFSEFTAPCWLTSKNTIKVSTMDNRWFWALVLKLKVKEQIQTNFRTITRIE